ncbi:MAG: prepilin-type N-terminal cleavage/methylation domain-containing protein [Kiritimatiellae bacterium]|nr:prepilin-type N-terminal cleavage/methylation domain-containing protein [Kiritimatiellia bacterium]
MISIDRRGFSRRGFTLVELLVVIAMIAVIIAALAASVTEARLRAKIERARSEASIMTQAILAYENYNKDVSLPEMEDVEATKENMAFLIGDGEKTEYGDTIPALMLAQFRNGVMRDPWYTPYRIRIRSGKAKITLRNASGTLYTGYFLPNYYNLTEEERR